MLEMPPLLGLPPLFGLPPLLCLKFFPASTFFLASQPLFGVQLFSQLLLFFQLPRQRAGPSVVAIKCHSLTEPAARWCSHQATERIKKQPSTTGFLHENVSLIKWLVVIEWQLYAGMCQERDKGYLS